MRLLPRPEAVTGEVLCGSHRRSTWSGDGTFRVDVMCIKPANHDSVCSLASVKAFRKVQVEEKAIDETGIWGHTWNPRPSESGQAKEQEREWQEFYHVYVWDMAARGQGDVSSYRVEHPDQPGRMVEVSAEDFNEIAKRTGVTGGYNGSDPKHVYIVREVLRKYV